MKDKLLYDSLVNYYNQNPIYKQLLYDIIQGNINISLRSIDWFITNYSKKHNIYYQIYKNKLNNHTFESEGNEYISKMNIYHSYKSQLKAYSKKKFDPFCRRERILYCLNENQSIETTIGQLNFFKWALNNLIIDYIQLHQKEIEIDMNTCLKEIKLKSSKKNGKRKKREELSLSASRGLTRNIVDIEITFD